MNMMKFYLKHCVEVLIDKADAERVLQHRWSLCGGYPSRHIKIKGKYKRQALHNFILEFNPSKTQEIDHINRNKLDNRRENLRIVSRTENTFNQPQLSSNTTGLKGVFRHRKNKKWRAQIGIKKTFIQVYYGLSKLEAAYAYNLAAKTIAGDCAYLNAVPEPPNAAQIKRYVDKQIKQYAPTTQPN